MAKRSYDYDYWDDFKPSRPLPADGIKAKSQRGQFASTWWATKWIQALERLMDSGRLSRGRSYARGGQVLNLDVGAGSVKARVQGSRPTPYRVNIAVTPLSDADWERAIGAMAEQAIFAARLLNGEMPENIEEAFAAAKVHLFPSTGRELLTSCSCPDPANPCKHIAAVYFLLGEQFDADPFLLFVLRGRSKEQIMAALRVRRSATAVAEAKAQYVADAVPDAGPPLTEQLALFWQAGSELANVRVKVAAPLVKDALLKRLGAPPVEAGRRGGAGNSAAATERLSETYGAITATALERAYREETKEAI
jgi:uncharacterized Zn finger protein